MASVGSILGGAFGLLRERPGAVVVWGVTYCVGSLVISAVMSLLMFGAMMPAPGSTDPNAALNVWMGPMSSLILFLYLCLGLLAVVLMNAVFRAMLRPQEGGFFFMRLGMDEFRMLGLVVLAYIAAFIATFVGWLLVLLLLMIIGVVLGPGTTIGVVGFALFFAFFCAMIWAQVRLSLIFPLTFHRRRITIDGGWALTRGRFWTLFACYFLVGLVFVVVAALLMWPIMSGYFAALAQANGDREQMRMAAQAFAEQQFAMPIATRILYGAIGAVYFALALPLGPGLLASATRELLGDGGEAAVFAAESDGSVVD